MNYLILFILLISNLLFAECYFSSTPIPNKLYELNCDGNIVSEKCGLIKGVCEINLNKKLENYNMKYESGELVSVNMINKSNADLLDCATNKSSLECIRVNNCKQISNSSTTKVLDLIRKKTKSRMEDNKCFRVLNPNSFKTMSLFSSYSCELNLEKKGINELDKRLGTECLQVDYNENKTLSCEVDLLLNLLNSEAKDKEIINLFQKASCGKTYSKKELIRQNAKFSNFLKIFFSNELSSCNELKLTDKSIDQLICFKAEEFKFASFQANYCEGLVYRHVGELQADANARKSTLDPRNITGQPEKESFSLPTEAPVIKNQETLQKIDKLIADNGGEMTPEVAKKAGEIFNSGIYQPTKNFLNSVEQAITGASSTSGTSGRSSSNFKSNNSKSYEIGAKASGGRTVANITEEVPSAARATALNGKMASGGSNMLVADAENPANAASANREAGTGNTQNDKKLAVNNFAGGQGLSGFGGPSGSGSSAGVGSAGFSSSGSADRNQELQQLPSLSSEEKSEITKVVQALKGAESPEDVKSIVTGEDNYQQVKRIVQELEQSRKNATSNPAVANARNPASAQASLEVKEFEKTLEKFGIKVYGEAGPGKAVYAPTSVNHVIVIKSNSVQFLNTIRSKK